MAVTDSAPPVAKPARWTAQWKELYSEVIQSGLCSGCAGCVISCPDDVIGYTHEPGEYKPFQCILDDVDQHAGTLHRPWQPDEHAREERLYRSVEGVRYPAAGDPALAGEIAELVKPQLVDLDRDRWGLDHGT